ncbi:hypothetical protein TTHERM_000237670 (macronuclear) [Tetrahymena thermophila SB210]|uniref:Uncharacterized protein n=1 Tax=Tetrahymena thermophila (strain SB210) TaxID=312017 RepID=W7X2A9_TETTS|nr:hypothetical protein TTHERM_000237670 [Tetrahymena thermophila SB210]EWS71772.1 hypothetical protein TTHERM_000237670 [Tetrahymena thermophila SB210]|eukprot:XP_012655659.1 hypothetical protein TTHERM_000237670 [Tetrahymena thermophila SB210]
MKQNLQQGRSQTRTPIRAKKLDNNYHNQSIQSTAISSQLNNSSIELSIFNSKDYKFQNQSTDSIIFDNNINFQQNFIECSKFETSSQILIDKYSGSEQQYPRIQQQKQHKAHSSADNRYISNSNQIQNTDFIQRPKRRLSPKQKEVNKIISRIYEERLFPILIKECSNAGILTKEQVKDYDIKQHFKNQKAEEFMLGNKPLLNKLNLNSSYNTIGNYTGNNKYLKVDLDYEKLKIDPEKTKITKKQQRIKNFFEGINPAQIKMKVLPPLRPVQLAIEEVEETRKKKQKSSSTHLDNIQIQRSSVIQLPSYIISKKQKIKRDQSLTLNNSVCSINVNKDIDSQEVKDIQQYDNKKQFQLELDSIFNSSQVQHSSVYEVDVDKYKKRITPTPIKKNFMPTHYKDRIVALNIKF